MTYDCGCHVAGGYKIEYCSVHRAAFQLLDAAEATLRYLEGLEIATSPADALKQSRQRAHAALRAKLEPAIAAARRAIQKGEAHNV
jgi:hypothetical protein